MDKQKALTKLKNDSPSRRVAILYSCHHHLSAEVMNNNKKSHTMAYVLDEFQCEKLLHFIITLRPLQTTNKLYMFLTNFLFLSLTYLFETCPTFVKSWLFNRKIVLQTVCCNSMEPKHRLNSFISRMKIVWVVQFVQKI